MSTEDKSILDRAEGLGQAFGEKAVKVSSRSSHSRAMVYATSIRPGLRPCDWYRELVIAGAYEHELPEEYIWALKAVEPMNDTDSKRADMNRRLLRSSNTNKVDARL